MNEIKIISEAGFLIPLEDLSKEAVSAAQARCLYRFYKDSMCAKCEYLEDRHSENCGSCEAFVGARQMVKKVVFKGKEHLSIPRGRRQLAINVARKDDKNRTIRIVSGHKAKEVSRPIRLLKSVQVREYQAEAIEAAVTKRRGILKSPPRSGKTLMGAAIICKVGKKAIILASQREWLVQFKETFYGSTTQEGFTNARPGQVDFARTYEDFQKTDVCLCTFSQFMSEKGKAMLARIRDLFEVVVVDEVHKSPALASSRVLSGFNSRYCIGLSGTPQRKCLHPDTPILCGDGSLKEIRSLRDGDLVQSPDGYSEEITGWFSKPFVGQLIRLETMAGRSLEVTPDHMLMTQRGWVRAEDLTCEDSLVGI